MKTFKKILAFGLMVMGLMTVGCSKDSGSSNNGYHWVGNSCYSSNNQYVSSSYCQNNTNSQYYYEGNICRDRTTGYQVNTYLCQQTSTGYGQQCFGYYTWNNQTVYCSGYDCRGWNLISQQTGQSVFCQ